MAIISVPSSIQGNSYSVRIAGDTPTPEEQAKIAAYVAQMDARIAPAAPVEAAAEEPSALGEFGSALGRGFFGSLTAAPGGIGALAEAGYGKLTGQPITPGSTAFGGVLQDISEEGRQAVEGVFGPSTDTTSGKIGEAIGSIGSFLIPGGVVSGGARLLGAGARAAGALGTAAGAGFGASLGADQQVQEIGDAILNGDVVDPDAQQSAILWGGLIGTSEMVAGGAASKLIGTTYKILNKVPPSMKEEAIATIGGRIRSALTTGGIEGAQEALAQVAQNLVSREYYDEGRRLTEGAGESFGIGGAAGAAIDLALTSARAPAVRRGIQQRQAAEEAEVQRQIEEDQLEDREDILARIGFGETADQRAAAPQPPAVTPADFAPKPSGTLSLPAPQAAAQVAPAPQAPIEEAPRTKPQFRWRQYTSALNAVAKSGDATIPSIQRAASPDPKKLIPPAAAKEIRSQLVADGVLAPNKKAKGGFSVKEQAIPQFSPAESYRRTLDDIEADIQEANTAREKALQDARRAEQTGSRADARKFMLAAEAAQRSVAQAEATRNEVRSRLAQAGGDLAVPSVQRPGSPVAGGRMAVPLTEAPAAAQDAAVQQRSGRLKQALSYYESIIAEKNAELKRIREAGKKVQLPNSEKQRVAGLTAEIKRDSDVVKELKQRIAKPAEDVAQARAMAAASATKAASDAAQQAARTPVYTAKEGELFTALRKRLDNLGLSDVKLVAERMIRPKGAPKNALVEGMMDVDSRNGNRIIAVAMGIYDPKMSQQELFDAVSAVMNHEVIHAIRSLGLFTDAEWKVLSDLATRQQYMKLKGGKVVQRNYTYLQRAKQMYPNDTQEVQFEEAVAEMFRDYVAGRLKIGGRPRTLMERIKDFFRSIWKSHEDVGFTDANAIFEGVRFGDIGKRERKPVVDANMVRQSRVAAERAPSDPDFQRWASGPNGERVITDADGKPKVYYTGTSKDQDFTKFKVDRHGGWFTTDPNEASMYAEQNDSMKLVLDPYGANPWSMKKVNAASRVMPVFLRVANPFTGPKPEEVLLKTNYKKAQTDWFDSLRRKGYDAWMPEDAPSLAVMLNDPSQVKSVFARGTDGKGDMRRYSLQALPDGVAAEEEVRDPKDIVMPIDPNAPVDEIKAQIKAMTDENVPIIRKLLAEVDAEFGTKSNDSVKDPDKVIQKATRPSILYRKPWHTVAHIRDTYRFQTQIDDFRQAPAIFQKLLDAGVTIVKIDTNKLFNPTEWGWRIIAFDLRMPNGQLVEYQLPLKEMLKQKKAVGHDIYEEWRGKTQAELIAQQDEYLSAIARSYEGYSDAFFGAMERLGMTPQEAEAAWMSAESSLLEAARNSRRSSGVMTSSSVSNRGFQTPSSVRMEREPSSLNRMALGEPSSTSANVLGMGGTSGESVSQGSVQDNLTPDQLAQVRYSIAMVRNRPVKGVGLPINAPVRGSDGKTTPHYGTIFEDGRPIPVLLNVGSHNEQARAGIGMAHIKARGHDKELFDNSRYQSVEQAIYDLMYRWSRQGHKDGEDVIAYPYDGNLTLEWRNNLTRKSPPLRLVLSHHDADGYKFYAVKTFFPVLPKTQQRLSILRTNNRSTELVRGMDELVRYAEDQVSWRDWYDRYQSVLDDLFEDDSELFRSILSATSQAASVPANVGLAIKAYDQMLSGQPFTGFLPAVIKNLNRIRADEALAGRKIGEYGRANEGDDEGIAVDRHIAMIMFDTINPSAQQVEAGKAAIRVIAERLGWKPREVQAALWAANIKRMGKEPQSYDTFLLRKADQIRALREKFPANVSGRDGRGAGVGRGADVGIKADGARFSVRRVTPVFYQGEAAGLTPEQIDQLNEPIDATIDRTVSEITERGGLVIRADQVENMADDRTIRRLTPKDLVGMKFVPTIADRTAAGAFYEGIDGAGVDVVIPLLGGPFFPLRQTNIDNDIVWANRGKSMLTRLQNAISKGATHIMVVLGDADMHISNTTVANSFFATLEGYARQGRFSAEQAAALTNLVRNSEDADPLLKRALAEFPGLDDYAALDDYLHRISFEARKRLLSVLATKEAQKLGAPSMTKILRATRQKELSGNRWGDCVMVLELDRNNLLVNLGEGGTSPHPDFPLGVRGKLVGRLETPLSYELVWKDFLSKTVKSKTDEYNKAREAAGDAASGMKPLKLDPRRSFETSLPIVEITPELAESLSDIRPLPIDGFKQARLAADFVAGNWKRSTASVTGGGVSPQAFLDAVANSDYSASLTKYDLKQVKSDIASGKMLINQLGDGDVYYGLKRGTDYEDEYGFSHPDLTNDETAIVSVVNNEQGARGIGGPAIMIDAIANGATVLDCLSVKTDKFPKGFLPTFYSEFGFEVLGEVPFDPSYFNDIEMSDLKAAWKKDGWREEDGYPSVAFMKWRGTDADRKGITSRYLRGGTQGLLAGRVGTDGAAEAADISFQRGAEAGAGAGVERGVGGPSRTGGQRSLASRLRETATYIAALNDTEIKNLGVSQEDRSSAVRALIGELDSAAEWPKRYSIRYAASPISPAVRQKVQSNQQTLMYARASDAISKALNLGGYGIELKKARQFTDGLLRRFQDSMLPVGRMIQELSNAGMTITDAMDPYLQEELMHGVVGQKIGENQKGLYEPLLDAVKKVNVSKAKIDELVRLSDAASREGKGFAGLSIAASGSPRLGLAETFLYARHAKERNRYIKANRDRENDFGSGMTDAEADAIMGWFRSLDPANQAAFTQIGKMAGLIVADTNKTRLDGGLLSDEVVDTEEGRTVAGTQYRHYVPLRGKIDEESDSEFAGPPALPRFGAKGREDRKALGRFDYPTDILANLFTQNQNAILRAERNKVGQSFLKLLRANPQLTSSYARILPKPPTVRASVDGKMRDVPSQKAYSDPDILVVKENGKEVFVRFTDERLAGALNGKNGMSPTNGNLLLTAMQKVNRYLASINTSYNPEFFITNMFRDLQTAGVNVNQYEQDGITKDVLGGLKGALVGIKRVIRNEDDTSEWSKVYKDFMAAGGQNATNQFNSLAEEMDNIQTLLGDISEAGARGQWAKVKNSFIGKKTGSLLQFIEDYNTVVENGIRVATYKALLDRGFSRQRAAQAARNVTVNFAKGGDYRQAMNAWYLFYNASLQGSFALLNAAVRSGRVRKLWASVVVMGLLNDQFNSLLSDDDEDGQEVYDKIPDYILEHNFIIMDPLKLSGRGYIAIPMPYGLNMAYNAGRAMSRAARGGYDAGEATSTIFGTMVDTLNPIGGFESWANLFAPTVVDPFIDIIENRDFADKPIYKEGLPFDRTPAPDSQQYWATTSPSAVWLANALNELTGGNEVRPGLIDWSPDVMEFWFDYVTGGVGRFVQRTAELPFRVAEEGISEELFREVPFVRKAIGSVSSREDTGSYIEGAKAVLTAAEELKRAREVGDADWVRETMTRYQKELRLVGPIKSIDSALRKVSQMRNEINDNPSIPDAQRRILLDRLEERRQMLLSRANSLLNQL